MTSGDCASSTAAVYTCTSPTVTVTGTADASTNVVVAATNGYWLGETVSSSTGSWSISVTLLANTNAYALDAFEVGPTTSAESSPSVPVTVTVQGNQLLTNGDFDLPSVTALEPGITWAYFSPAGTVPYPGGVVSTEPFPGWSATNDCGIELETAGTIPFTPYDNSTQYAELASDCVSGLTQTVATVPGTQYTLSFAYAARPGTAPSAQDTMSVEWGGQSVAPDLQGVFGWTLATYTLTATTTSTKLEFDDTDTTPADSEGDFLDNVSVVPTASLGPSNTSWSNAQGVNPVASQGGQSTGTATQSITYAGEGLWYDFPIQPGEQVNVQLSNVTADYQVLLFSDISLAQQSLTSGTPDIPVVQAESSGNNDSSATFSPFYGAPFYGAPFYGAPFYGAPFYGAPFYGASSDYSPFYGAPFYGAPFYGAADDQAAEEDSILAESSQTGAVTQSVTAETWNDTGDFYVEI
ncbi:MAG: hypothetical protein ABSE77_03185, partial [Acidimicrobiales bacterium]